MSITPDVLAAPRAVRPSNASVSVSLRGPRDAVLTVAGDAGPAATRLVEVMLDTVVAEGACHVIADLAAVPDVSQPLRDVLASASWVLERRGGWLLVEGNAEVGRPEGGGMEPRSSLLDAFRAYRATVER